MIALSNNLIVTFSFYELLTIFTYPLITNTKTKHEEKEARFCLLFLMATSFIIFFPVIIFIYLTYSTINFKVGGILYNPLYITPLVILTLYGVAKSAIIPVHFWLPRAMIAPAPVSALLHSVAVVKSGIFILLKMYIYIFGTEILQYLPSWQGMNVITILCALSLVIASVLALYQVTIKKLLAYSTISHLSICLLAASSFTAKGIAASILHLLSHAIGKLTLFLATGYIYSNTKITKIAHLRGLGKKLPITSLFFTIGALSLIGIPPFAGFISKTYILYVAIDNNPINYLIVLALIISMLLSTQYFGSIIHKLYFQEVNVKNKTIYSENVHSPMLIAIFISTTLICMYIFIYPSITSLLERIAY
jgi:formate hydrogenlyase subunit 3/multisubunit Na+/H+ antiporter MnhD subunit